MKFEVEVKAEVYAVKSLGEKIGYGHMMEIASELWARDLEDQGLPREAALIPTAIINTKKRYRRKREKYEAYKNIVTEALSQSTNLFEEQRKEADA